MPLAQIIGGNTLYDILSQEIKKIDGQIRIVPIEILKKLENDTYAVQKGEYGSDLIDLIARDFFSFQLPDLPFTPRSIIIAAMPSPYVMVKFNWNDRCYTFPNEHYRPYTDNSDRVETILNDILIPLGYHVKETGSIPMKPLAVRSGLSLYGRNNITFVEGMGSLITLKAFFSDIPWDSNTIGNIKRMDSCEHCSLCLTHCPTGAIKADRHIIKAEECLTYLNEFIDAEGFPDWLSASAHNSLHGCIVCQAICPRNRPYLKDLESKVEFDKQETQWLLEGTCMEELPEETAEKIRLLCLEDYLPLLPRNLSVLFAKEAYALGIAL